MLTLQDMEQDSLQFDLAADTLEELFEWYQVAWDITQQQMSKQYNREQEVSISQHIITYCKLWWQSPPQLFNFEGTAKPCCSIYYNNSLD